MSQTRVLTGFGKGSTAFSQIVKRVHDTKKVGNHWYSEWIIITKKKTMLRIAKLSSSTCIGAQNLMLMLITGLKPYTTKQQMIDLVYREVRQKC